MSEDRQNRSNSLPEDAGKKGGQASDQEAREGFGRSFTTNSGLDQSTGVARKDTPDAAATDHGIAGGPDTGTSTTAKP